MNYAVGSSFNLDDMMMNFPYKKLKVTCKECMEMIGNEHRDIFVKRVFVYCLKQILYEVINEGVTFIMPTGARPSDIHLHRISGDDFKKSRKNGKFKDIDYLTSYFSAYEVSLFMYGNGRTRRKSIYLNKEYKNQLSERINTQTLPTKITLKKISDYYEYVLKQFPLLKKSDCKRILNFAFKSLYLHNSYGGDTFITDNTLWCFIGTLRKDSIKHYMYYIKKLTVKLRVLYKRKKIEWDGYYYFALSDNQYNEYVQQKKSRGRPRKKFKYGNQVLYKIFDECRIQEFGRKYIFRVPQIVDLGFTYYKENLILDNAELIVTREPLKFKDILVTNNNYEFL